ncbi:MAG: 50S ribosomal protein L24 [Candidatus Bathyarchaeia archaeon]
MTKSKKPSKQRKMLYQAPHHKRGKYMAAPLSKELKDQYRANAVAVRRGDTVRIMRGDRRGFEGKVMRVDRKNYKIFVEGVTREKADGTTIMIPIHPSKVMISRLNLDDKWRRRILERKAPVVEEEIPEVAPLEEKPKEKMEPLDTAEQLAEVEAGGT